jgi:hypothetical protein
VTPKERFVKTLQFKPVDRVPFMEIALWGQTSERWKSEGAPSDLDGAFMLGNSYFGLEGYDTAPIDAIVPHPQFEARTLEENDEWLVFTDCLGRTRKGLKVDGKYTSICMDHYIDFAVKDRKSFLDMRRRYEGDPAERYPKDWNAIVTRLRSTDRPVTLLDPLAGTFGYYSMLRNWFGTEPLSYQFYDDPALIHECLEFLTDFAIRLLTPAVKAVPFDFYFVHEDLSGKGGPLIGPNLFREFILPHYKRFIGFLKTNGVKIVLVDTDGDFEVLIPLFLEAGVDGFGPMEVASDMDPASMRKKYGKSFCMMGGVDKRAVAKGKRAIDEQLAKLAPVIHEGGYIPMIDHSIPPDVSLANFQYYLEQKRKVVFGHA